MDKLQAMSVFVRIAENGSLTAAAGKLDKSLPAVVRILAALEGELQVRLFNRTTRRIALTEEGRVYLQRCRKILAEIEDTERMLSNEADEPAGSLTLTAPVRFGEMHVAPAVYRFLQKYPRMKIRLLLLDRMVNMLDEGIDVAVRIASLEDSTLIARPIGEIRRVVCASHGVLSKFGVPDRPEELADLPCVRFTGISAGSVWYFRQGKKKISVKIDGKLACNQTAASVDACLAGLGFGQFLSYQIMPYVSTGKLQLVLQEFEQAALPISLVYQHTRYMSSTMRIFIEWMVEELKGSLSASNALMST